MTTTPATTPIPAPLEAGTTVYLVDGTKFAGRWDLATVEPVDGTPWARIVDATGASWSTCAADTFATEADAQLECKIRRAAAKARRAAKPAPVAFGDYGQLVGFLGNPGRKN